MNKNETVTYAHWKENSQWARWTGNNRCPNCLSDDIEYNTTLVLTTEPPQYKLRCLCCNHHFNSGFTFECTNKDALNKLWEHDQSILGTPQVGDWPPTPTPQDPIYIPHSPDTHNYGWVCPKCGRSLAPHIDSCPFCNQWTQPNITC